MKVIEVEKLLVKVDAFINTLYVVRDAISLPPTKEHISACINYSDLKEMRDEFVCELVHTAIPFVYSPSRRKHLLRERKKERDEVGAWSELIRRAKAKFRTSCPRGQFSELILCNVLQHYFRAAPLLRKMRITTNPQTERLGADAIHVGTRDDRYILFLGEAKTYDRKTDTFKAALVSAIDDGLHHYQHHRSEIDLYLYEDFLSPELEQVADAYRAGRLGDMEVEIVSLATFDQRASISGRTRQQRLDNALECVRTMATTKVFQTVLKRIPHDLLPRMNYVVIPTTALKELLDSFAHQLGGK